METSQDRTNFPVLTIGIHSLAGGIRVALIFLAFDLQEMIPDIVVMGKPIGNDNPMAAMVTRREITELFPERTLSVPLPPSTISGGRGWG